MNQKIIDYLNTNKKSYSKESLMEQLRNAGHNAVDITEAINIVYGDTEVRVPLQHDHVVQDDVRYAGFWIRVVASLIDMVVIIPCAILIVFFAMLVVGDGFVVTMILKFLTYSMGLVYFIVMTNEYQATLGKMAVGIKVCDATTLQKAVSKNIILREILSSIMSYIPVVNLLIVVVAFTQKKQGIHDFAANSVVIYKNE